LANHLAHLLLGLTCTPGQTIHSSPVRANIPKIYSTKLTYEGYIQESGAIVLSTVNDPNHTNFTYLADKVNCTEGDEYQIFECMQNIPATDLIAVLNNYNNTLNEGKSFHFNPQADNETSFGNYSERGLLGRVAPIVRKT
jgi:Carboxylesterase family